MSEPEQLSYQQESLWYREVFTDRAGMSNVPVAVRLCGPLDTLALRRALLTLLTRHDALRTTFDAPDGVPRRHTGRAELDFAVAQVDDDEHARRLGRAELVRPFDLAMGPPVRFRLYRLAAGEHVLVVVLHHLVTDAWSIGIMLRELGETYRSARLPALPLTYGEFVERQRADRDPRRLAELAAYWDERLGGAPQTVSLVTDRRRPRTRQALGAVVTEQVPAATLDAVRRLAAQTRTSEFIVLLAAFRVLLWRHTGQRDALIGAPVSGRDYPGTESLIGFFINMLVLRQPVDPAATFRQLLAAERESVLGAFDHRDMPYSDVVQRLSPDRDSASSPLVQVTFSYRPDDDTGLELPGLTVTDFWLEGTSLQFDLVFELLGGAGDGLLLCGYNNDIFDHATMAGLTARYLPLLTAALAGPDRPLTALTWLIAEDETAIARAAHGPATADRAASVVDLILRQAPEAVAVRCGTSIRTYGRLDADSAGLAARLHDLALAPESVVGILVDNRADLPAALLGVLRAGLAILPLDPRQPAERHALLLADAQAEAVVSDLGYPSSIPVTGPASGAPACPADPDSLAYVLYTSGSTGRPKGVAVSHGAFANAVRDAGDLLGVAPGRQIVAASTIAFDISLLEIFLALAYGAELILASRQEQADPAALAALLTGNRPDYFFATPARWQMLLHAGWTGTPGLTGMVGGDVLTPALAARIRSHTDRLWQMYGPTETTVFSTRDEVPPGPGGEILPIGRPITGTVAYVLDADLRPVAPGVMGELCLGGAGLARGYLGRPGQTAERFVPDPYASTPGARLYRTGDLARLLPDGRFELRGRNDDQVKIRGNRIELGEIEAALTAHPRVAAAAAVIVGESADKRIVACLQSAEPGDDPVAEVRQELRRRLPQYLIPSSYVLVPQLPTTVNGKVDRAALAETARDTSGPQPAAEPVTEQEKTVAALWAETLGVARVGRTDDFFALGGNSVLAARVMGELRGRLGVRLPMSALLEASTVATFAERLEDVAEVPGTAAAAEGPSLTTLRRGRRVPQLVLAHPVGGSALCYREMVGALQGDWQVSAFECGDPVEVSLEESAARYLELLAETGAGPVIFAGWSLGGLWAYEMGRQALAAGREVPAVLIIDTALPGQFDWDAELAAGNALRGFLRETLRIAGRQITPPDDLADPFGWLAGAVGHALPGELAARFAIAQANLRAARAYEPGPAELDLYVVVPEQDPVDDDGWIDLVDAMTVRTLPGDHYSVIAGAGAKGIAALLADLD